MKKVIAGMTIIILICFCGAPVTIVTHSYTGENIEEYFLSRDDYIFIEEYDFQASAYDKRRSAYYNKMCNGWHQDIRKFLHTYYVETETKAYFVAYPRAEIIEISDETITEADLIYIEKCPYPGMLSDLQTKARNMLGDYLSEEIPDTAEFNLKSMSIILKRIIVSENKEIIDDRYLTYDDYTFLFIESDVYILVTPPQTSKMALVYPKDMTWEDF